MSIGYANLENSPIHSETVSSNAPWECLDGEFSSNFLQFYRSIFFFKNVVIQFTISL